MPNRPEFTALALCTAFAILAGCGPADVERGINDPYEDHNRAVHEFNKSLDRSVLRPVSNAVGKLPEPILTGISNFAQNTGTPADILNDFLQAEFRDAGHNTARFMINSTVGIFGFLDPATDWGLPPRGSDFGETLHAWGAAEGHYVELPFLGPSTKRDTMGKVVDVITNPLNRVLTRPERNVILVSNSTSGIITRHRIGGMIDSVLYDSVDSYAQSRLLYLESRRFRLGNSTPDTDEEINPYGEAEGIDPYAEGIDPYEESGGIHPYEQ